MVVNVMYMNQICIYLDVSFLLYTYQTLSIVRLNIWMVNGMANRQNIVVGCKKFCYIHTVNLSIVRLNILDGSKCDVNRQILFLNFFIILQTLYRLLV
jgi:hypothetical protein